jgi:hypothetical protein
MRSKLLSAVFIGGLAITSAVRAELLNNQLVEMPVATADAASSSAACPVPANQASVEEFMNYGRCERDRLIKNTAVGLAMSLPAAGRATKCRAHREAFSWDTNPDGTFKYSTSARLNLDNLLAYQCITKGRMVADKRTYALASFYVRVPDSCKNDDWMREHFNSDLNRLNVSLNIFHSRLWQVCRGPSGIAQVPGHGGVVPSYAQASQDYPNVDALITQLQTHGMFDLLKIVAEENGITLPTPQLVAPAEVPSSSIPVPVADPANSAAQIESRKNRSPAAEKINATRVRYDLIPFFN